MPPSLHSMTGFGSAAHESSQWQLRIEIKTTNHRYFSWHFQASVEWLGLEGTVRRIAQEKLQRGDIRVFVTASYFDPILQSITISQPIVKQLVQTLTQIGKSKDPVQLCINLDGLLRLPGMFTSRVDLDTIRKKLESPFLDTFRKALDEVLLSRASEGRYIQSNLERDLEAMKSLVNSLDKQWPAYLQATQKKWKTSIEEKLRSFDINVDDHRIASEIILLVQKADAREELDRLISHIEAFQRALTDSPAGRRLEFITQEMVRESTTLSNKVDGTQWLETILDLRSLVDRLREQVQNIE